MIYYFLPFYGPFLFVVLLLFHIQVDLGYPVSLVPSNRVRIVKHADY